LGGFGERATTCLDLQHPPKGIIYMAKSEKTEDRVMSQEEIDERASEADRLRRYGISDPDGLQRETEETEVRLTAKYL